MPFFKHTCTVLFTLRFCLAGALSLPAQPGPILERLTVEDGLSQGFVYCITQDREGFLWVGTRNGLNRYDGREFRSFINNPLDPHSIAGNIITSIADYGDCLLLAILGKGLNVFDKKTARFYRLRAKNGLPEGNFGDLLVDQYQRIWCRVNTMNGKHYLLRLSLSAKPAKTDLEWRISGLQKWDIDGVEIGKLSQTKDKIWGVVSETLVNVDKKTGYIQKLPTPAPVFGTTVASDGSVWCYGNSGLGRQGSSGLSWWDTDFIDPGAICLKSPGELWIASPGDLFEFSNSNLKASALSGDAGKLLFSTGLEKINTLFCDRSGVLWAGTNGYGLLKYTPRLNRFTTYLAGNSINLPMLIDGQDKVGVLLKNGRGVTPTGLSGKHHFPLPARVEGYAKSCFDRNGTQWLLMNAPGEKLNLFSRAPDAAARWVHALTLNPGNTNTFAMAIDTENNVWIAAYRQLVNYSPANRIPVVFSFAGILPGNYSINTLTQTSDGSWWIGTDNGLIRATPQRNSFTFHLIRANTGQYQSIQNDCVNTLLPDPTDSAVLWIGTRGGGLSRLDTRTMAFRHFNSWNGFPDNVIYGILADAGKVFWMSSNKGIIRFNPVSGAARTFTVKDGLPTNEFNVRAYAQKADGTMFFGCVEGLVAFHPGRFSDNSVAPQVRLTGLDINNKPVVLGDSSGLLNQAIEFTHYLELPFSSNDLSFYFAALEFSIPLKNAFQYYLQGAEREWAHTTTDNKASYLNMAPGAYRFRIRACNSDGVWNETPAEIRIVILPPWYRTKLAYSIYALLFLAFGYGVFRFMLHRQRLHDRLAMEQREAGRLKELDAFKSRLYTNISHELRTPLTLIRIPVEQHLRQYSKQLDSKARKSLEMVLYNSRKLLALIEELLDLSKLETSKITLRETPTPLARFVRQLFGAWQSMADLKTIDYRFQSALGEDACYRVDRIQLEKILNNLLANALKFTPKGGAVELRLRQSESRLLVQVCDTGPGIPAADLPHIFERYFQSKTRRLPTEGGFGIGLALSKELAQLMGGDLRVESQLGGGSVFTLAIPAREALPDASVPPLEKTPGTATATEAPPAKADKAPATDLPGRGKLLIVEDTPGMQQLLLSLLQEQYNCQCARNGLEAWQLLTAENGAPPVFDLIISDVMMPEMDGYALLEQIKNHPHWKHHPVILLTARAAEEDKLQALRMGVDDYLTKPFSAEELLARVANLIRNARQRQAFLAANPQAAAMQFAPAEPADQLWLAELEQIVKDALDKKQEITTLYLAQKVALSDRQLLRRLKALTGLSSNAYIQEIKLQKARHLLENKAYNTIAEVAFACSFNTPAYFSRVFERRFGKRPGEYG